MECEYPKCETCGEEITDGNEYNCEYCGKTACVDCGMENLYSSEADPDGQLYYCKECAKD